MVTEQPENGLLRQAIILFTPAASLLLAGCAGLIEDWQLRKRAVDGGVDEAATAEALVPRLPIVRFDLGEIRPSPEAEQELRSAAADLMELDPQTYVVLVEGHTDATGPADINYRVAEQRARAVADILIDQGVDPDIIKVGSFGPDLPVATNALEDGSDHPTGRRFNRRVEVMIAPRTIVEDRQQVTASAS